MLRGAQKAASIRPTRAAKQAVLTERAGSLIVAQSLERVSRHAPQCPFGAPPSPEFNSPIQNLDLLRRQPPTRGFTVFLNVVNGGRLRDGDHVVFRDAT